MLRRRNKRQYHKLRERARSDVAARIGYFNAFYNFKVGKVFIKDTRSRWGSCSKAGNLNFSYKITLLPPHVADYLVVHELCHLREFNHSPAFWALVSLACPNYRELKRELRQIEGEGSVKE